MIKVEVKNGQTRVEVNGTGVELTADATVALRGIYRAIAEKSTVGAMAFGEMIKKIIDDPKVTPFRMDTPEGREEGMAVCVDMAELMRQLEKGENE